MFFASIAICLQVFALANNNFISIDPSDIDHIKHTVIGASVALINFAIIKPLQHSVVYEFNAELEKDIKRQQNIMNN